MCTVHLGLRNKTLPDFNYSYTLYAVALVILLVILLVADVIKFIQQIAKFESNHKKSPLPYEFLLFVLMINSI